MYILLCCFIFIDFITYIFFFLLRIFLDFLICIFYISLHVGIARTLIIINLSNINPVSASGGVIRFNKDQFKFENPDGCFDRFILSS